MLDDSWSAKEGDAAVTRAQQILQLSAMLADVYKTMRQWGRYGTAKQVALEEQTEQVATLLRENAKLRDAIEALIVTAPRRQRTELRKLVEQMMVKS
jgi:type II secretory pathway component PulF